MGESSWSVELNQSLETRDFMASTGHLWSGNLFQVHGEFQRKTTQNPKFALSSSPRIQNLKENDLQKWKEDASCPQSICAFEQIEFNLTQLWTKFYCKEVVRGKYKTWNPSVDPVHGPGPSKYGPGPWTPFMLTGNFLFLCHMFVCVCLGFCFSVLFGRNLALRKRNFCNIKVINIQIFFKCIV